MLCRGAGAVITLRYGHRATRSSGLRQGLGQEEGETVRLPGSAACRESGIHGNRDQAAFGSGVPQHRRSASPLRRNATPEPRAKRLHLLRHAGFLPAATRRQPQGSAVRRKLRPDREGPGRRFWLRVSRRMGVADRVRDPRFRRHGRGRGRPDPGGRGPGSRRAGLRHRHRTREADALARRRNAGGSRHRRGRGARGRPACRHLRGRTRTQGRIGGAVVSPGGRSRRIGGAAARPRLEIRTRLCALDRVRAAESRGRRHHPGRRPDW